MQLKSGLRQIRHDIWQIPGMLVNIYRLKRRFPLMKIYTYQSLVGNIKRNSDICHVIATGASALDAFQAGVIKPDEYIIGFNFAAFLPYTFNFYFFEDTFSSGDFYKARTKAIAELLNKRKDHLPDLVYKNARTACPKMMSRLIPYVRFSVVFDRVFYYPVVKKLFSRPSVFMPQYASSVITAVMLAYHAGFRNIIVHGLDFSGPHIYHDKDLQKQTGVSAPTPYVTKETAHVTATGQEMIWPELIKAFSEKNVNVFCASPRSNFKKYAKIWRRPQHY